MWHLRNRNDYVILEKKGGSGKWIYWTFFGILGFIAIYIPFFGTNLRYQASYLFSNVFNIIGTLSLTIGGLLAIFGFAGIFMRGKNWIKSLILGGLLLWIGCWCLGIPSIWDIFSPGTGTGGSGGYH
jgi:hypothetical protein